MMKVATEIRECGWIGKMPVKWQGHAFLEGQRMMEPMISGDPANSEVKAKHELEKALTEYIDLGIKAKSLMAKNRNFKTKQQTTDDNEIQRSM